MPAIRFYFQGFFVKSKGQGAETGVGGVFYVRPGDFIELFCVSRGYAVPK